MASCTEQTKRLQANTFNSVPEPNEKQAQFTHHQASDNTAFYEPIYEWMLHL